MDQHAAEIAAAEAAIEAEENGLEPPPPPPSAAALAEQAEAAAVEAARRDPAAYAAKLTHALATSKAMAAAGREDAPPGWEWVACDACERWRLVPGGYYREKGLGDEGATFTCVSNSERPGAGCHEANDWPEEGGGGGGEGGEEEGGGEDDDVWGEAV